MTIAIDWDVKQHSKQTKIKALQALHDTPPLCLFLLSHMFWHEVPYRCISDDVTM